MKKKVVRAEVAKEAEATTTQKRLEYLITENSRLMQDNYDLRRQVSEQGPTITQLRHDNYRLGKRLDAALFSLGIVEKYFGDTQTKTQVTQGPDEVFIAG